MFLHKFKTPGIAHTAYLIAEGSDAVLVDPARDIERYLAVARDQQLHIKHVLETHRQEDFVMGSRAVRELVGAHIVSGEHELFGSSDVRLGHRERLRVGGLELLALHTPGHTPESMCYAVFLDAAPARALGVFSGDTLFIGETGRTDLSDPQRTGEHAGQLFDAVHGELLPLGDQALLWPAHGAGSVCGGNIADRDESTLGFERTYNPVFTQTREAFIRSKLEERIPRPPYFSHMERVNRDGGLREGKRAAEVPLLSPASFAAEMKEGVVLDARTPEAFAGGHIPGSINVWLAGLGVFAGWLAREDTRVYLVLPSLGDLSDAVTQLGRVGLDALGGALSGGFEAWRNAGMPIATSGTVSPAQLERDLGDTVVLDVRDDAEVEQEGHIPGALHMYVGYLPKHLHRIRAELEKKRRIAVTCSVGNRAGIAVSLLERHGLRNVENLLGGMRAWQRLALPVSKGHAQGATTPDIEGQRR